jgi:hypothetical protein
MTVVVGEVEGCLYLSMHVSETLLGMMDMVIDGIVHRSGPAPFEIRLLTWITFLFTTGNWF